MPKENKNTSRRSRRQSTELDNESATGSREPIKSVLGGNRYSPFPREASRRDSRTPKENMIVPSNEALHSISSGIIENGIKYIMLPLHLLRFCIFGTSSSTSTETKVCAEATKEESSGRSYEEKHEEKYEDKYEKKYEDKYEKKYEDKYEKKYEDKYEEKYEKKCEEKYEDKKARDERREERSRRETSKSRLSTERPSLQNSKESRRTPPVEQAPKEDKTDTEDSSNEMVTAEEDSDSCGERWCTAQSTMIMNMSLDYDNFDKSMSLAALEEPMDISIDDYCLDKTYTIAKVHQGNQLSENAQNSIGRRAYSGQQFEDQASNSSVDEEISRIFQKQCTSSDDDLPSSSYIKRPSSYKYQKARQSNYLHSGVYDKHSSSKSRHTPYSPSISRSKKGVKDVERERRKKMSSEYVTDSKRRKVVYEEERRERHSERRSEKTREERRGSGEDTPSRHKSRSSRNSSESSGRSKESKGKDIRYKETATQTDSAFSDDDVEMIPVDAKLSEGQCSCMHAARKSQINLFQGKEMKKELNYVADNEDSNDGFLRIVHKRVSSRSTSSSSTDLGFDERFSTTSDTDTQTGRSNENSRDNASAFRAYTRAPPGFPEIPQNPPLTAYNCEKSEQLVLVSSKDKTTALVPPAPSPMRHLYYNYPEFMDLPVNVNSSKILSNILKNNYPR